MRLFVAVPLPSDIQDDLADLCQGIPGARWVPPENMHLTLRFVGEVGGHVRNDIVEALERVRGQPFDLHLSGVGHFESGRKPRALWVGVERSRPLQQLQESVEAAIQRAGQPPEGRKFKPHVTLARLKEPPGHYLPEFLAEHNLFRRGPVPVDGFTLFSSFLSRNGALYRPEADFPFDRPPRLPEEEDWSTYDPWNATADPT